MGEPVTIAGIKYSVDKKMTAFQQLHVTRRVLPIMGSLVALMKADVKIDLETALPAMAEQIAGMPDADIDFIVKTCLSVVKRQTEAGWVSVLAANGMPMFDDIDMMALLQLTGAVIQENVGGFFGANGLTSRLAGAEPGSTS